MPTGRLCGTGMKEMMMNNDELQRIILAAAAAFDVNPMDIVEGRKGSKSLMYARDVCAYLLAGKMPRGKIPNLLGRNSKYYYYGAIKKVRAKCLADHDFEMKVLNLAARLG